MIRRCAILAMLNLGLIAHDQPRWSPVVPEPNNKLTTYHSHNHNITDARSLLDFARAHPASLSSGSAHADQLFNRPEKCASWKFNDYWNGLIQRYGYIISDSIAVPAEFIRTDYHPAKGVTIYIHRDGFTQIMRQPKLYEYEAFWHFIKSFNNYEDLFLSVFDGKSPIRTYSTKAHSRIVAERKKILGARQLREDECRRQCYQASVSNIMAQSQALLVEEQEEWRELSELSQDYGVPYHAYINERNAALEQIKHSGLSYSGVSYSIDSDSAGMLQASGYDPQLYEELYGNQLQHALHTEYIDILAQAAQLSPSSPLYDYKGSIVDLVESSRLYNANGECHTSSMINDLCWSILDYGSAILEGVAQGIIGAARDIIEHPLQTVACVVAGEYVLAYQLLKITTNLAHIGVTYLCDPLEGKRCWDDYIQPITQTIDALTSKEISLRDAIKGATTVGIGLVAQQKMLKGLGSLYTTTRAKAIEFAKSNPTVSPESYMATPDGIVFKVIDNYSPITNHASLKRCKIKKIIKNMTHFLTNFESQKIIVGDTYLLLDKKGMKHILSRHHPKFWNGTIKTVQSFFDKKMQSNEMIAVIKDIINQNRNFINKTTESEYQIRGVFEGVTYVVGIKNGRIGQFYNVR